MKPDTTLWSILRNILTDDILGNTFLHMAKPKCVFKKDQSVFLIFEKNKVTKLIDTMNKMDENIQFEIENRMTTKSPLWT